MQFMVESWSYLSLEPNSIKAVDTKTLRPDRCWYLPSVLDYFFFSSSEEKQKEEFQAKGKFKIFFCLIKEKHEFVLRRRRMRQKGGREPGVDS